MQIVLVAWVGDRTAMQCSVRSLSLSTVPYSMKSLTSSLATVPYSMTNLIACFQVILCLKIGICYTAAFQYSTRKCEYRHNRHVCMYGNHIYQSMDQPGKVANPAGGELSPYVSPCLQCSGYHHYCSRTPPKDQVLFVLKPSVVPTHSCST